MTTAYTPPPLCEQCYRKPAAEGHEWCTRCINYVPTDVVRRLVWRIQGVGDELTVVEIARRAEVNHSTLSAIMRRGSQYRRLGRDKFVRLVALAEEVGA